MRVCLDSVNMLTKQYLEGENETLVLSHFDVFASLGPLIGRILKLRTKESYQLL